MKQPISIMLVEDSREYREVIRLALKRDPDMELTGEFGTAEIALRSLQEKGPRKVPDLILLDLNLPGMGGLDALPWFTKYVPDARVIVLTQSDAETDVLRAISLGASGYLLKSATIEQIKGGIRTVADGGASLDAGVAKFILNSLRGHQPKDEPEKPLSARELEVLTLLAEGDVKKDICDRLEISYSTVDKHVRHIYDKLKVSNAPSAVNKAHRMGLFPPEA